MDWYILAILSVFASSFTGIFRKLIGKENKSSFESIILFQFFGAIIVFLIALSNGFKMPPITEFPFQYALTGILWGSAMIFLFNAYKKAEASEVAILATFETLIVLILGNKILNDTLTPTMIIGIFFIISSIIILSYKKFKRVNYNRGFTYAIAASVLAGVASVNDAFLVKNSDPISFVAVAYLLPGIFVYLIYLLSKKKITVDLKNTNLKYISLLVLFSVISNIPYYLAINYDGQISQVLPINKTSIIFTILLAALFLNERKELGRKIFCGILAAIGVILLN